MTRSLWLLACCAVLAGCGGGDSRLNPLTWFGGSKSTGPATLEPEGGYAVTDERLPIAQVLSARWEQTVEGRLLVVTGLPATRGWWDIALVTETPQPPGRVRPDGDGVLRLRLVGSPPPAGTAVSGTPARPELDRVTVAFPISAAALDNIRTVTVSAGANSVSLKV